MTRNEMIERGRQHYDEGKKTTPFDCRAIDKEIIAESKSHDRPAKFYAKMRGAFNKGWEQAHSQATIL